MLETKGRNSSRHHGKASQVALQIEFVRIIYKPSQSLIFNLIVTNNKFIQQSDFTSSNGLILEISIRHEIFDLINAFNLLLKL